MAGRTSVRATLAAALAALSLAGCESWFGNPEAPPLPGERLPVLTLEQSLKPDPRIADLKVSLPKPKLNADWPQAGGGPTHAMYHLAAPGKLEEQWSNDIGSGADSETLLLAQPVIVGNRVYTMDSEAEVRAYDVKTGDRLWRRSLEPDEDDDGTLGGGIAYDGGRLYVSTGFAQVIALDAASGKVIWRRTLSGPMRAAPTVKDGRLFVVTIANELQALSTRDGRPLWSHIGITEVAGLSGGASPAVGNGVVVAPYSSGEVVALRVENGRVVWSDALVSLRRTDPVSSLAHIRGRPVIDRGRVFVISHSGRMVAIDLRTGSRIWEKPIGGVQGPWVAGDFVYVVSNDAELVCLSRRDGRIRWVRVLQRYEDEEDKEDPIQWAGPVLAGNRLLVANSNSELWTVSPESGKVLRRIEVDGPVMIAPAVANGTVYLLTDDADLIALR